MNTLKFQLLTLALFSMQEGNDPSPADDRYKGFVDSLGLSTDLQNMLLNAETPLDEVKNKFIAGFEDLTKQSYLKDWDASKVDEIKRSTQKDSHIAFQKRLTKHFGFLDSDEIRNAEKPTQAMIEALANQYEELKKTGDQSTIELKGMLDKANAQINEWTTEMERLKQVEQSIPDLEKQWKGQFENQLWIDSEIAKSVSQIENLHPAASIDKIKQWLSLSCDFEIKNENGQKSWIAKDKSGRILKKTDTATYENLTTLLSDLVLVPNGWITKQNPPANPPTTPSGNGASKGAFDYSKIVPVTKQR